MAGRGVDHERLADAAASLDIRDAIRSIDRDIKLLERASTSAAEREEKPVPTPTPAGPGRDDREVIMPNAIDTFRAGGR
jgi:hypothetical protein